MRIWPSLWAFMLLTLPAQAFDCGKAATAVEQAICAAVDLKALDDRLEAAYGEVKALSSNPEQKMLGRAQKAWLAAREANCPTSTLGLAGCIKDMTSARVKMFEGTPESGPGTGQRLVPVFIYQTGTDKAYDLAVDLYRFADPDTEGERRFNAWVEEIAGKLILGPHGMDSEGHVYAEVGFMTLSHVSPDVLSVLHSYWSDTGGAHGNGGVENLNLDMKIGKELTIADILSEDAAASLAKDCRQQIVAEKQERLAGEPYDPATDDFLKDEVIAEHIATLSRWSFTQSEASISFDPYAIGSFAEGSYDCRFALSDLESRALPGAPLP